MVTFTSYMLTGIETRKESQCSAMCGLDLLGLLNGPDGCIHAVPDLDEGRLDVAGCDDEVCPSQLRSERVLDSCNSLGVVHRDSRGWIDGGAAVSTGPGRLVVCTLYCISRGIGNDQHLCVVKGVVACAVVIDRAPGLQPEMPVRVEVNGEEEG